ncbi:MAG TPA: GHMP kinase [Chloroflexota bacterium]|nr:GHMP kinase [Chloroflexota bacterium]
MFSSSDTSTILARAPLRLSFAGGGTDLPAYYERYGGLVLSTTISRSAYALLAPGDYDEVHIVSSNYRTVHTDRRDSSLSLPWAVIRAMRVERGASIFLSSDVPPGTGLGSSSATAVALITAVAAWRGRTFSPMDAAELASRVEIVDLGQSIGKQDQYAAAHGGINLFAFGADGVRVTPVTVSDEVRRGLERHLTLYFTGSTRQAGTILKEQHARIAHGESRTMESLHALKEYVAPMYAALQAGDYTTMGALLHEAWQLKRRVSSGISTGAIDLAYDTARAAGALGGKITGAGGGGFLLLLTPPHAQDAVDTALRPLGLRRMAFTLEPRGAHTIGIGTEGQCDTYDTMVLPPVGVGYSYA